MPKTIRITDEHHDALLAHAQTIGSTPAAAFADIMSRHAASTDGEPGDPRAAKAAPEDGETDGGEAPPDKMKAARGSPLKKWASTSSTPTGQPAFAQRGSR